MAWELTSVKREEQGHDSAVSELANSTLRREIKQNFKTIHVLNVCCFKLFLDVVQSSVTRQQVSSVFQSHSKLGLDIVLLGLSQYLEMCFYIFL